jgi:cation diffusion facilitator family transporter
MTSDPTNVARRELLHRRGIRLEWFTIAWNVLEAGIAIVAGAMASSTALVAFGVDSLIEITSAIALLWRLLRADPDASDAEHGQAERRALYVVAGTFFALAAYTAWESIRALIHRESPDASVVGLALSALSLVIMPMLAFTKHRTGSELGSKALQADAVETWVCAYLSLALLAGVGLTYAFGWWWADSVGALAMLPVIVWQGWETLADAREHGDSD